MSSDFTLMEEARQFQAIVEKAEFSDHEGNSLDCEKGIQENLGMLGNLKDRGGNLFLVGNGGSAGVVSHILTDFINVNKLNARTLHESSLLSCMSNDYGYENSFSEPLSTLAREKDLLIAVSSSGRSPNIHNAVKSIKKAGGEAITLSGFGEDNPLRSMGDLNIWLDSTSYGLVEIGHLFYLHYLSGHLKLKGL
ncbi:MAG TPA: SIS domain-containing protein [Nitrospinaceae bacterium]|nr:SIS domain-containing protein [Nitrospinaceae bacterium]